jgi:hypothetical protein
MITPDSHPDLYSRWLEELMTNKKTICRYIVLCLRTAQTKIYGQLDEMKSSSTRISPLRLQLHALLTIFLSPLLFALAFPPRAFRCI